MKYFVLQISTNDYTTYAKAITETDTIEGAKQLFHQIMASAYAASDNLYTMAIITNEYGANEMMEIKRLPAPAPEPEPEEISQE